MVKPDSDVMLEFAPDAALLVSEACTWSARAVVVPVPIATTPSIIGFVLANPVIELNEVPVIVVAATVEGVVAPKEPFNAELVVVAVIVVAATVEGVIAPKEPFNAELVVVAVIVVAATVEGCGRSR